MPDDLKHFRVEDSFIIIEPDEALFILGACLAIALIMDRLA